MEGLSEHALGSPEHELGEPDAEAALVLARLGRVRQLDGQGAPAWEILAELRLLVGAAQAWVALEGDAGARSAAARLAAAVAGPDAVPQEASRSALGTAERAGVNV